MVLRTIWKTVAQEKLSLNFNAQIIKTLHLQSLMKME